MRGIVLFISMCVLYICVEYCTADDAPIVKTEHGPVRGVVATTVYKNHSYFAYYSIPYGKAKRFQAPEEPDPWTDVFDATKPGNICMQYNSNKDVVVGSEDCLNLHVYTPKEAHEPGAAIPVMVWIHGGAFLSGSPDPKVYGPDFFIERGVIVVAITYRLGPLGFLALKHPEASGNAGLEDQRQALLWVQKNIAKFGGDPKSVTIFGQSAGGASVDYQVLSHKSKGLFHRAITQSGVSICPWAITTPDKASDTAFSFASALGYNGFNFPNEVLAFLRNVDAKVMVKVASKDFKLRFVPTVQPSNVISKKKAFLPDCPYNLLQTGKYNKVPRITGYAKNEGLYLVGEAYTALTKHTAQFEPIKLDALSSITSDTSVAALIVLSKTITDAAFVAPIDVHQQLISTNNDHEIYYYRYSLDSEYAWHRQYFNVSGTGHCDELPLLFNTQIYTPNSVDTPEGRTRRTLVDLWTNFAKYGNPTPAESMDSWTSFIWEDSRASGAMLDIGDTVQMTDRLPTKEISVMLAESAITVNADASSGCTS